MTIALGILCADGGVIVAADTQESWGYQGGAKISGQKIITRVAPEGDRACSATGAGSAGYLDSLNQELTDNFLDVNDRSKIERRFREKVSKFYEAHVLPMHVYPANDQPSADVIVGMSWKAQKPLLLANERTALRRCKHHVTAGAGMAHASMLLTRLLPSKLATSVDFAAFLAAFVIFQVKSYVEGCGMGTHVTVLKDGEARYIPEPQISALEKQFDQYWHLDTQIVEYIGNKPRGAHKTPLRDMTARLNVMRRAIHLEDIMNHLEPVIDEATVP
jgi:hypothetical protein